MDFSSQALWLNALIFAGAAVAVWISGTLIAEYADEFARRFQLSRALLGLFLLSGITSLPEIATSFTAASSGNAELAVNNLLGSIVLQVTLLAIADLAIGRQALTSVVPDALVLLQGSLNIVLLALVTAAITIGDVQLFGAGAWSWGLLGAAIYAMVKLARADRQRKAWVVNPDDEALPDEETKREQKGKKQRGSQSEPIEEGKDAPRKHGDDALSLLYGKLGLCTLTVLIAGALLAYSGEALAEQTGLGQSFAGVALVAVATSLPEISTVFAAVRAGFYTMAISDIFGTNILNVALISGVDLIDREGAVLDEAGAFSVLAAILGILVTGLFTLGLSERADRTYLRMGVDSILVLLVYVAGMYFLFQLREGG